MKDNTDGMWKWKVTHAKMAKSTSVYHNVLVPFGTHFRSDQVPYKRVMNSLIPYIFEIKQM